MMYRDKLDKMCLVDMLTYLEANRTQPNTCIAEMITGREVTCLVKSVEDDEFSPDCFECIRRTLNEKAF